MLKDRRRYVQDQFQRLRPRSGFWKVYLKPSHRTRIGRSDLFSSPYIACIAPGISIHGRSTCHNWPRGYWKRQAGFQVHKTNVRAPFPYRQAIFYRTCPKFPLYHWSGRANYKVSVGHHKNGGHQWWARFSGFLPAFLDLATLASFTIAPRLLVIFPPTGCWQVAMISFPFVILHMF